MDSLSLDSKIQPPLDNKPLRLPRGRPGEASTNIASRSAPVYPNKKNPWRTARIKDSVPIPGDFLPVLLPHVYELSAKDEKILIVDEAEVFIQKNPVTGFILKLIVSFEY
jgi:hypothetical protein